MTTDEATLRAMADRYHAARPAFAAQLYALADYVAQFTPTEPPPVEPEGQPDHQYGLPPVMDAACPMMWARPAESLSGTSTTRDEVCGRPAVVSVEYEGQLYDTCPECAEETEKMGGKKIGDRRE